MPMNDKPDMPDMPDMPKIPDEPIRSEIYARVSTDKQGSPIDDQVSGGRDNNTFDILSESPEREQKQKQERGRVSEKIFALFGNARRRKARRSEWRGGPPIGYKVDKFTKKLAPDPETSHIPQLIFDLYVNKRLGTFKVAEYLNERGFRTKNGNRWSREAVGKVLRNPAYIGQAMYGARLNRLQRERDEIFGHKPLIKQELFDDAQARLSAKGSADSPRQTQQLLTGILRCGGCGEPMVCQERTGGGRTYRYYICMTYQQYGRTACPQAGVNANVLEHKVLGIIREKLELLPTELFFIAENLERNLMILELEAKRQQVKMEKLKKKQIQLFQERDLFAEEAYRRHMLDLKRQIEFLEHASASVNRQLAELREEQTKNASFEQTVQEFKRLDGHEPEKLRALLHDLIREISLAEGMLHIEYRYDMNK